MSVGAVIQNYIYSHYDTTIFIPMPFKDYFKAIACILLSPYINTSIISLQLCKNGIHQWRELDSNPRYFNHGDQIAVIFQPGAFINQISRTQIFCFIAYSLLLCSMLLMVHQDCQGSVAEESFFLIEFDFRCLICFSNRLIIMLLRVWCWTFWTLVCFWE